MDVNEFRKRGKEIIDLMADYYENINTYPPLSAVERGYLSKLLPTEAPQKPESFEDLIKDFNGKILPGVTHWQSGNFFAWYSSTASFPSLLGDMLSGMINCVGFNWICSPACTELETIVLDWLAKAFGIDDGFLATRGDGSKGKGGGVIQGSASEAHIVVMLAAREKMLNRLREQGMSEEEVASASTRLIAYGSDQTHSSGQKASMVIGCKFFSIPSNEDMILTKENLEKQIEKDRKEGLIPFFVCGTFGTTNTCAIDDFVGIGEVAKKEDLWFHVDAAYAGCALVCPEYRHLIKGTEISDSFNVNPNKFLLVNFDFSALWVKNSRYLRDALSCDREYYRNDASDSGDVKDYRDWQLPLGRRFRSLKLWFVMRLYGIEGLQQHIQRAINLGNWFEKKLLEDGRFEIVTPVAFGLVVFRIKESALDLGNETTDPKAIFEHQNDINDKLLKVMLSDGRVFLSGSKVKGKAVVRAVFGGTNVNQETAETLLNVTLESTNRLLGSSDGQN
ncbi:hypothetical protein H4219_000315 [Mycoemilia scoparia]|uniref:Aromatic-L-amino-acid decarboxylase n=1 Tax=Mycoemilia scoparia TaxID=417184 RepID=A0A9W8DRQ3_9FUNG|nr:hypothetical protein H4219_000315 [Mycoemilia scoparia]